MRHLAHIAIGICFWVAMVVLWVLLILEHKAGSSNIAYSAQYIGVIVGIVLAVTFWWIRHNVRIHQRKGPRRGRAEVPPRTDEDRLGRPLVWDLEGGSEAALDAGRLVVELAGDVKTYRAED